MNALNQHWQKKNAAKQNRPADGSPNGDVMPPSLSAAADVS
jgi:hypothetical protein